MEAITQSEVKRIDDRTLVEKWCSEKTDKILPALLHVSKNITNVRAESKNPFFSSKYADLDTILLLVKPLLCRYDLILVQGSRFCVLTSGFYITSKLYHTSGQFIYNEIRMPIVKKDPQGVGSATTYGRRYGLSALLNISVDKDDDGNKASGTNTSSSSPYGEAKGR